tara:strand:- start:580 stop:981 length:402 start_codon:yes stop_codon:yes gene_type:complete
VKEFLFAIKSTKNTPDVILDLNENRLSIKGVSYPEDADKFYDPICDSIRSFLNQISAGFSLNITVDYDYFNTSTARMLYKLFAIIDTKAKDDRYNFDLEWMYESDDFDMIDSGKDFDYMFKNLSFNFCEKQLI